MDYNNDRETMLKSDYDDAAFAGLGSDELGAVLKANYGRLFEVRIEPDEIGEEFVYFFKKPLTVSFNRVMKTLSKDEHSALKAFTLECIVAEQRETYEKDIEDYPGLSLMAGQKLMGLMGVTNNVTLKKF